MTEQKLTTVQVILDIEVDVDEALEGYGIPLEELRAQVREDVADSVESALPWAVGVTIAPEDDRAPGWCDTLEHRLDDCDEDCPAHPDHHKTTVEQFDDGDESGWVAKCRCEWEGTLRQERVFADDDAADHEENAPAWS